MELTASDKHDFTEAAFRQYLQIAKQRFEFIGFDEVKDCLRRDRRSIAILRHDIDASPQRALALAKIEKDEEAKATFFVQLDSFFYNVFEPSILKTLRGIIELGFPIGLHISFAKYPSFCNTKVEIEKAIDFEKNILQKLLNIQLAAVSFHDPPDELLSSARDYSYAGLINTYSKEMFDNFTYVSDSNGYWRHASLSETLNIPRAGRLQILLHPEWWQKKQMLPWERIARCVEGRLHNNKSLYVNNLNGLGRKNVGFNSSD